MGYTFTIDDNEMNGADAKYFGNNGSTPAPQQTYDWYNPTAAYGRVSNGNGGYTGEYTFSHSARDLQGKLNEIARQRGEKEIAVDGYYGKETADAVKRYLGGGVQFGDGTPTTNSFADNAINNGASNPASTSGSGSSEWKRPEQGKATTGLGLVGNPTAAELKDKTKIGEVEFTPEDKRVGFGEWLFGKRTPEAASPDASQYAVEEEYRQQAARDSDNGTIPFEMLAKQELDENGETGYYRYLVSQVENQKPPEYLDEYAKPRSAAPATTGGTGGKKSELDSMPLGEMETKPFNLGDFGRWLTTGNKAPAPTGGTGGKQSELDAMPYSSSKPSEEYRSTVGNGNTDADYERRRIDGTRYMSEAQLAEIVKDSDPGFYRYLQNFITDQGANDKATLEAMSNAAATQAIDNRAFGTGATAGNFAGTTDEDLGRQPQIGMMEAYTDPEFWKLFGGGLADIGRLSAIAAGRGIKNGVNAAGQWVNDALSRYADIAQRATTPGAGQATPETPTPAAPEAAPEVPKTRWSQKLDDQLSRGDLMDQMTLGATTDPSPYYGYYSEGGTPLRREDVASDFYDLFGYAPPDYMSAGEIAEYIKGFMAQGSYTPPAPTDFSFHGVTTQPQLPTNNRRPNG